MIAPTHNPQPPTLEDALRLFMQADEIERQKCRAPRWHQNLARIRKEVGEALRCELGVIEGETRTLSSLAQLPPKTAKKFIQLQKFLQAATK